MTSSASSRLCPECGKALPPSTDDQPRSVCPACLMAQAIASGTILEGDAKPGAVPPPSPEMIADKFPQFEILECLGRGGMGVVYKARQKSLNRTVAIKILAPEREHDTRFAARFAHEAELLARLSHPHIVTIHDFGEAGGLFYIVMEFVDGVNLRDLLREGKIGPRQALAIVPPVCEALQYAHDHGIVHRDIKPENLLLDREGRVKIADFGIASLVGAEGEGAGTPPYMAPEQGGARPAADHRADIYALGVVLYEMLTGERPGREVVAPSRKVQIDVRLDEIVLRALEKQPDLRYTSATEFKTRVETVVAEGTRPERTADSEQARLDACTRDPANWHWFFLYFCREDPRIVVPRRISGLGWTLNFARPLALPFLAALVAFVLGVFRISELLGASGHGLRAVEVSLLVAIIGACHRMSRAPRLPPPAEGEAPAWKIYLRAAAWLLPLVGAWYAAVIFVLPKLNEVGTQNAMPGSPRLPGPLLAGAAEWSGPVLLSLAALVMLAEAGWPAWRRYRGRVLAGLTFGLGLVALAGLCLMILQGGLVAALSRQNHEILGTLSRPLLRVTVRVLEVPADFDDAGLLRPSGLLDSGQVKILAAPYVVVASGDEGAIPLPAIPGLAGDSSPGSPVLSGRTKTLFVKPALEPGTAHVRYALEGLVSGVGAGKGSEARHPLRSDSLQLGELQTMESNGLPDGRRQLALISVEMEVLKPQVPGKAVPASADLAAAAGVNLDAKSGARVVSVHMAGPAGMVVTGNWTVDGAREPFRAALPLDLAKTVHESLDFELICAGKNGIFRMELRPEGSEMGMMSTETEYGVRGHIGFPGGQEERSINSFGNGVTLGFIREPGSYLIGADGSRIEIAKDSADRLTLSLTRMDGEKSETVALPEFVKGDGWFAYVESPNWLWIFDGVGQLDVLTPTGRYSVGDVGVRAFCPAVVWKAVPASVGERLESGRPGQAEEESHRGAQVAVPETISFGGVEWQAWRTLFEVRDGSLASLPRVRPGFDYGHGGHGRGPEIITNIGNPEWRDYRIDARLRVPGVDPAFNPHGLELDFHGAMIAFHIADRKESFNERGTSAYVLGFEGEGNWSLAAHYNNYCRQPQGWGHWGGDGERKLASGSDVKLDREKGNRFRIELRGKRIQVWLDDRQLVDLVDEQMDEPLGGQTLDHGGVAFVGGFDAMIRLEEFSVTRLDGLAAGPSR